MSYSLYSLYFETIVKLEKYYKDEKLLELLMPCIIKIIIEPRFKLIAVLENLYNILREKYDEKIINKLEKDTTYWILRGDIGFIKLLPIPDYLNNLFKQTLGTSLITLLNNYQNKQSIDKIKEIKDQKLKLWINPSMEETIINDPVKIQIQRIPPNTLTWNNLGFIEKERMGSGDFNMKTYIDGGENPNFSTKKLIALHENIQVRHLKDAPTRNKLDKQRFSLIFKEIEKIKGSEYQQPDDKIYSFWYGDFYRPDNKNLDGSDSFISFTTINGISIKIKNIDLEISKLILQTYIAALFQSIYDVKLIYNIIATILQNTNKSTKISPNNIYQNNMPTNEIQNIITPVLHNMVFLPGTNFMNLIEENWNKFIYPTIDISNLISFIRTNNDFDRYKRNELADKVEELDIKNLSSTKIAKKISDIVLKHYKNNIKLTYKIILETIDPQKKKT
jgi:hypothetical protein